MKKLIVAYGTLAGFIGLALVGLIRAHDPDFEAGARRPRSIRERMLEERQSTARTELLSQERTGRNSDDADEPSSRDAFDKWFYGQRKYPADSLPPGALAQANAHADNQNFDERDDTTGPKWNALGPIAIPNGQTDTSAGQVSPVSGRVTAIATDPSNPDIAYIGGAQGGIWKTRNASNPKPHFEALTDHEASLAIGAIAVDPVNPDIIYVGTGEANRSCDSYYGQGVLRSTDGGQHWTLLGSGGNPFGNQGPFVGKTISKILIDPATAGSATSTTIWASTTFGFFDSGTDAACDSPNLVGPVGLWRSTDSGQTWQLQNVPAGGAGVTSVQDAAIDPTNSNIVYAAVRSTAVYKSTNAKDANAAYTAMTNGFPAGSSVTPMRRINVAIGGAGAPNALYAAIENGASGDRLFGLFKSANGGALWSHIDNGFNGSASFANVDIDPGPGTTLRGLVTRISGPSFATNGSWNGRRLLVTQNGQNRAVLSRTVLTVIDGDHLLLTTTTGFAAATTALYSVASYPSYCDGQCFYDMTIAADPADATGARIYVGGNPHVFFPNLAPNLNETACDAKNPCSSHTNWRSDDGGVTWASISQGDGKSGSLHTDDHAYAFGADGALYDGNDGGAWRSTDRGFSWTTLNTDLAITQFQGVALDPTSKLVIGGTQDNGTNLSDPKLVAPPSKWFHADFGDGGMAVIDRGTPSRMFHTYFNQSFNFMGPARSDVGGSGGPGSWPFVGAYFGYGPQYYNGMDPTDPVSFYAPLTQHPAYSPNVIYFGSNRVYRSPDPQPFIFTNPPTTAQPVSWKAVSPALTKPPVPPATSTDAYLTWIGVLPNLVNGKEVVYTGASDGRVSVSSNVDGSGIAAWTVIDKAPLPNRAVTQVLPVGSDPTGNTVYVTFSGFNGSTPATPGHVFMSANGLGSATWVDISGDLPDIPVNAIAVDQAKDKGRTVTALYVGTDVGVFESLDGGAHWRRLSKGMPNVAVFGLAIDSNRRLVAATHGRGMFELNRPRN